MDKCDFKVSDKTVELLTKKALKYYEEEERRLKLLGKLSKAGNDAIKIVQVFIDMCWDMWAFEMLVDDPRIPLKDRVILFGIAKLKEDEWST